MDVKTEKNFKINFRVGNLRMVLEFESRYVGYSAVSNFSPIP